MRQRTQGTWDMEGKTVCGIRPPSVQTDQMKETPVHPVCPFVLFLVVMWPRFSKLGAMAKSSTLYTEATQLKYVWLCQHLKICSIGYVLPE